MCVCACAQVEMPKGNSPTREGWTGVSPGSHSQRKPHGRREAGLRGLPALLVSVHLVGPGPVPASLLASVSQLYQKGLNAELRKRVRA